MPSCCEDDVLGKHRVEGRQEADAVTVDEREDSLTGPRESLLPDCSVIGDRGERPAR